MENVILTGFMATGKSAVGRRLAQALGYRFLDTDREIEKKTALSIPRIFARHGEGYFRELERELVRELAGVRKTVIATGGGMIVPEDNYEALRRLGPIICLESRPEIILQRAAAQGNRPLLEAPRPLERIRKLLAQRRPAYARADFVLDTSDKSIEDVLQSIMAYLRAVTAHS